LICSVTRFSWSSASSTGATTSANVVTGRSTPGSRPRRRCRGGTAPSSSRARAPRAPGRRRTPPSAASSARRSGPRRRGTGCARELVADLGVELLDEAVCRHRGYLRRGHAGRAAWCGRS
jgi:hypothetical protein